MHRASALTAPPIEHCLRPRCTARRQGVKRPPCTSAQQALIRFANLLCSVLHKCTPPCRLCVCIASAVRPDKFPLRWRTVPMRAANELGPAHWNSARGMHLGRSPTRQQRFRSVFRAGIACDLPVIGARVWAKQVLRKAVASGRRATWRQGPRAPACTALADHSSAPT